MAGKRIEAARALEQVADALCRNCAEALASGQTLLPTLMIWYEGDELDHPGAVVVFEPPGEPPARPGDALRMARERLDTFTREASAWALAYEGLVSGDGSSSPAVMIEARLRRPPAHATLVRPFRPRSNGRPFGWSGGVARL